MIMSARSPHSDESLLPSSRRSRFGVRRLDAAFPEHTDDRSKAASSRRTPNNAAPATPNPPPASPLGEAPGRSSPERSPALLDSLRRAIRVRHYSIRTEHTYVDWVVRYVKFNGTRHPAEMGAPEINAFLTHLATDRNVTAKTQNQALCAIVFLYKNVLGKEIGDLGDVIRAKTPSRLPVVLSVEEVERIFLNLSGIHKLMVLLMYGTGMRIIEVIRLRIKDIDFDNRSILVREGKGSKDRVVPLPAHTEQPLRAQIARVKALHDEDLANGFGTVFLPHALDVKYPNTNKAFHWQYLFPSPHLSVDPRSGRQQRHHVYESVLQGAIRSAARKAGIDKDIHSHTFRHSFATHLLAGGTDIRTIQSLLGHSDVKTTEVYTHILKNGPHGVRSPADRIRNTDCQLPKKALAYAGEYRDESGSASGIKQKTARALQIISAWTCTIMAFFTGRQ